MSIENALSERTVGDMSRSLRNWPTLMVGGRKIRKRTMAQKLKLVDEELSAQTLSLAALSIFDESDQKQMSTNL